MTKDEFYSFCDANWSIIQGLYEAGATPSIDRIDSAKHYSLDNIRVVDLKHNIARKVIK